jgi:hypothetical protein
MSTCKLRVDLKACRTDLTDRPAGLDFSGSRGFTAQRLSYTAFCATRRFGFALRYVPQLTFTLLLVRFLSRHRLWKLALSRVLACRCLCRFLSCLSDSDVHHLVPSQADLVAQVLALLRAEVVSAPVAVAHQLSA